MASSRDDSTLIANHLLAPLHLKATSYNILQHLWSGYGTIARLKAVSTSTNQSSPPVSLILKHVTPPAGQQGSEGHLRKLISYHVEQYFYTTLAPLMPPDIAVARCLAHSRHGNKMAMILTDLREEYPVACEKRGDLNRTQVSAALSWLAKFHGFWWQRTDVLKGTGLRLPPLDEAKCPQHKEGPWLNGGYTYLATRGTEFASLKSDKKSEWARQLCEAAVDSEHCIAELVARVLSPSASSHSSVADYVTLIHGDVKSENLFATSSGSDTAFFDFQYVGLGLGVCDLAKLFTCSVPSELLGAGLGESRAMDAGERALLEFYQQKIQEVSGKTYPWETLENHWKSALVDWLRFQASWGECCGCQSTESLLTLVQCRILGQYSMARVSRTPYSGRRRLGCLVASNSP